MYNLLCCIDVWETYSISTIHVGCQRRLYTVIVVVVVVVVVVNVVVVVVVIVVVNVAVVVPVMYWYCVVCLFFVFDGFPICLQYYSEVYSIVVGCCW